VLTATAAGTLVGLVVASFAVVVGVTLAFAGGGVLVVFGLLLASCAGGDTDDDAVGVGFTTAGCFFASGDIGAADVVGETTAS